MTILPDVISSLSKEEIRNLKLFLNRMHSATEKMNEKLFDFVKKQQNKDYDELKIFKKLYPNDENKLTFNRLKSRLLQDISESLASFNFSATDIHFVLNHYLLYKTFIDKNELEIASYYIKRAEKRAEEIQHPELLDLIYSDMIKLSHELKEIDPEVYIAKRKENRVTLNYLHEIDDVLAVVIYKLRLRKNTTTKDIQLYQLLEKTIAKFTSNKQLIKNKSFKIKIYHALSRLLLGKKEYVILEDYLLKTYHEFIDKKLFDKNTHTTKVQMLVYICNTLYANEKYADSLKFAEKLKLALAEFDNALYESYVIYYYNSLTNNYNEIDTQKAIYYLNEAKDNKFIYKHSFHMAFVYYNLVGCYYDLKDNKQAIKNLVKLYTHHSYQNISDEMRLKINMTELMIRIQLKEVDFVELKIKQLQKDFADVLKADSVDKDMLNIIERLVIKCHLKPDAALRTQIKQLMQQYNNKDTAEVISYSLWLSDNFLKAG